MDGRGRLCRGGKERVSGRSIGDNRISIRDMGRSRHGLRVDATVAVATPAKRKIFDRGQNVSMLDSSIPVTASLPDDGGVRVGGSIVGSIIAAPPVSEKLNQAEVSIWMSFVK